MSKLINIINHAKTSLAKINDRQIDGLNKIMLRFDRIRNLEHQIENQARIAMLEINKLKEQNFPDNINNSQHLVDLVSDQINHIEDNAKDNCNSIDEYIKNIQIIIKQNQDQPSSKPAANNYHQISGSNNNKGK